MDTSERILEFMRINGPVIPAQVAREINSNILMASAHLSELSSRGKLKVSTIKVGTSPLYYLHGQEDQLQRFCQNLGEKEKKVYEELKSKCVLRDNELSPLVRVVLRTLKDFATPLQVNYKGASEIIWKWYMISDNEAEQLIKSLLMPQEKHEEIKKEIVQEEDEKKEKSSEQKTLKPVEMKKPLIKKRQNQKSNDSFAETVISYFNKNKIQTIETIEERGETDSIITIPSPVGMLMYFCRVKNKLKINEADVSALYIAAQSKMLPALLVTKGTMTKKAQEMLEREFKGMRVMRM